MSSVDNSANTLALLAEREEDSQELLRSDIDPEIEQWIATGVQQEHFQFIDAETRISSKEDARKLARQIAAAGNGAVRHQSEFGYLIFNAKRISIRTDLDDPLAIYIK